MNFVEAIIEGNASNRAIVGHDNSIMFMNKDGHILYMDEKEHALKPKIDDISVDRWELSDEYTFDGNKIEEPKKIYFIVCKNLEEALDYASKNQIPVDAIKRIDTDIEYLRELAVENWDSEEDAIYEIHGVDNCGQKKGLIASYVHGEEI